MTTTAASFRGWKFVAAGLAAGLLGGAFGIGGGLVLVPTLLYIGLERHRAQATSLAGIVLIASSGALSLGLADSVRWDVGLTIGIGGVVGSILGASTMHRMSVKGLTIAFGVMLVIAGIRMISGPEPMPGAEDFTPTTQVAIALAIGLVAGSLAGLTGIGGGVVNVPSVVFLLGLPQLVAQGSSFVAVVMTSPPQPSSIFATDAFFFATDCSSGSEGLPAHFSVARCRSESTRKCCRRRLVCCSSSSVLAPSCVLTRYLPLRRPDRRVLSWI